MMVVFLKKYRKFVVCGILFFNLGRVFTQYLLVMDCATTVASASKLSYSVDDVHTRTVHSSVEYAVVILSEFEHGSIRDTIRNTWMKLANNIVTVNGTRVHAWRNSPEKYKHPYFIKFYFVVGIQYMDTNSIMGLVIELEENRDLILLDNVYEKENFPNLSEKMLRTMEWLSMYLKNLKYVIKCDENSFVRIDLIIRDLEACGKNYVMAPELAKYVSYKRLMEAPVSEFDLVPSAIGLYWGFFTGQEQAYKIGKWAEKKWFQCDNYLPYALGTAYIISNNIVQYVGSNANRLSVYESEAVSMGLWTSALGGIHRVHDIRFDSEWNSCQEDTLVLRHQNATESFRRLINNKGASLCPYLSKGRKNYLYKWDVPPSKCCKKKIISKYFRVFFLGISYPPACWYFTDACSYFL